MGLRDGCYAKLWSAKDNGRAVSCYTTVSRKAKDGNGYEQLFNGFVSFFGDSCKEKILELGLPEEFDRENPVGKTVKIAGSPDITSWYKKDIKKGGLNITVYDVEIPDDNADQKSSKKSAPAKKTSTKKKEEPVSDDDDLPF